VQLANPSLVVLLWVLMQGKKVLFMTNNSMKSRESYLDKCLQVGLPAHVVRRAAANKFGSTAASVVQ
jgi:hypothetical protein